MKLLRILGIPVIAACLCGCPDVVPDNAQVTPPQGKDRLLEIWNHSTEATNDVVISQPSSHVTEAGRVWTKYCFVNVANFLIPDAEELIVVNEEGAPVRLGDRFAATDWRGYVLISNWTGLIDRQKNNNRTSNRGADIFYTKTVYVDVNEEDWEIGGTAFRGTISGKPVTNLAVVITTAPPLVPAHEIGHMLSLNHSPTSGNLMCYSTTCFGEKIDGFPQGSQTPTAGTECALARSWGEQRGYFTGFTAQ